MIITVHSITELCKEVERILTEANETLKTTPCEFSVASTARSYNEHGKDKYTDCETYEYLITYNVPAGASFTFFTYKNSRQCEVQMGRHIYNHCWNVTSFLPYKFRTLRFPNQGGVEEYVIKKAEDFSYNYHELDNKEA